MSDDRTKTGKPDAIRINVHEPYELLDWSQRLRITPDQLKKAVSIVGPMVADVKRHLGIP
jgi:hypothetical protein